MYKNVPIKKLIFWFFAFFFLLTQTTDAFAEVTINSPGNGETVGGIVPITATATGTLIYPVSYMFCNRGGGYTLPTLALSAAHTWQWDTTYLPNGNQIISALAQWAGDPLGVIAQINVNVYNPNPTINITSPLQDSVISPHSPIFPVTVEFHNNTPNYRGIKRISLLIDNSLAGGLYVPDSPASGTYEKSRRFT